MRLKAKHMIGLGDGYHAPGSTIELSEDEAARLIALGAAELLPADEQAEPDARPCPRRRRER